MDLFDQNLIKSRLLCCTKMTKSVYEYSDQTTRISAS